MEVNQIYDSGAFYDALRSMTAKLLEDPRVKTPGDSSCSRLVLLGVPTRGVYVASMIAQIGAAYHEREIPVGALAIESHRDDAEYNPRALRQTILPARRDGRPITNLDGWTIVVVDDVAYTRRTLRAALDAIASYWRPKMVLSAAVVDRGSRELPIEVDHACFKLESPAGQRVLVKVREVDGIEGIFLTDFPADAQPQPGPSVCRLALRA